MAEAKGASRPHKRNRATCRVSAGTPGCPRRAPRYWEISKMTANVVRRDGLLPATPPTCGWTGSKVAAVATGGFIAHPHMRLVARRLPVGTGPFIPPTRRQGPSGPEEVVQHSTALGAQNEAQCGASSALAELAAFRRF